MLTEYGDVDFAVVDLERVIFDGDLAPVDARGGRHCGCPRAVYVVVVTSRRHPSRTRS